MLNYAANGGVQRCMRGLDQRLTHKFHHRSYAGTLPKAPCQQQSPKPGLNGTDAQPPGAPNHCGGWWPLKLRRSPSTSSLELDPQASALAASKKHSAQRFETRSLSMPRHSFAYCLKAPRELSPHLAGASLTALPKKIGRLGQSLWASHHVQRCQSLLARR